MTQIIKEQVIHLSWNSKITQNNYSEENEKVIEKIGIFPSPVLDIKRICNPPQGSYNEYIKYIMEENKIVNKKKED